MARIVRKFGGAALADSEHFKSVAADLAKSWHGGDELVVVVSAMYGETDRLIELANAVSQAPDCREYDVLVSAGEQVSIALLSMALKQQGVPATSLLAHQVGIVTDGSHMRARIHSINAEKINALLKEKKIAVIAGFQGMRSDCNDLTTLGRGGSDLTAVALAAAINADVCEVYKDVEGVATADPGICRDASVIERISYEEMLELASAGAKVLQTRAVLMAKSHKVPIHVRSFINPASPGTLVTSEDKMLEQPVVAAVTLEKSEAKIAVMKLVDEPGVASELFSALTERDIIVDMIVQNMTSDTLTAMAFTVPRDQADLAYEVVDNLAKSKGWGEVVMDKRVAKISTIGAGMRTHSGVASKMFAVLGREGINISMIGTSEIRISCLIEEKYAELALRTLHEAFGLASDA